MYDSWRNIIFTFEYIYQHNFLFALKFHLEIISKFKFAKNSFEIWYWNKFFCVEENAFYPRIMTRCSVDET